MFGKGRKRTHRARDASAMDGSSSGPAPKQFGGNEYRKKKRVHVLGMDQQLEEKRLEKLIFGDASDVVANLDIDEDELLEFDEPHEASSERKPSDKQLNVITATTLEEDSGVEEGDQSPSAIEDDKPNSQKEPVWMDEDDENIQVKQAFQMQGRSLHETSASRDEYSTFLKQKYESMMGTPRWAELNTDSTRKSDTDSDGDDDVMQHSGPYVSKRRSPNLGKGMIETKHLKDLNVDSNAEGPIVSVTEFHPTSTVALVGGLNGAVSIMQVDGRTNTKLQTIQFERFPVKCAHFSTDGTQFLVGSQNHGHFFVYDMMEGRSIKVPISHSSEITNMKNFSMSPDGRLIASLGRFGHIHLITAQSKEWLGSLKMNSEVKAIAFNKDGSRLYSTGDGGDVYVWDMHSRSCIHRFTDDGCIVGTSLALSPNEQYLACGSSSGVVNIYEGNSIFTSAAPRPVKIALNLVTEINSLKFNASSEVLAMASMDKENAVRLMHFPSMTVFSNFPHISENVFRPQCLDFSPHSGFLTLGNNRGRALLYRLKHFGNY
ncbi:hypothetical protein ONE63_001204 [Megalurothrips usitatus]|uniref:U3 small nucleolar RNA-associated protein 18 homolog n=1 Tax=Megalurothrips usitatus TaxID=439358 RepID=A0AAV7XG12_9NEOP|nr:hypothetical protein ONE63_001204 [Megalurothrips usitatus]KAJ1523334.1 hypothetical protein ONE63_001204 [Megalurothrips usitatus]